MSSAQETIKKLHEIRSLISVPLDLMTRMGPLVDLCDAITNRRVSAERPFVVGYQSRLERWSRTAELTGPVSSPQRLDENMLEGGRNDHICPLQCWVDDLIGFLDRLRDCFTPEVIDMLAGDRSERVELQHAHERTYVQALYETIDSLARGTDRLICQVAAYSEEALDEESRSGPGSIEAWTIKMVDEGNGEALALHFDLSPGGWIRSEAGKLVEGLRQLQDEFTNGNLSFRLSEEVSAALVRTGAKEFGLTRAQELLLAARESSFQVLKMLESLRSIAQDKERLTKTPRLVEDSGIVAVIDGLERIPCQDVDSEGRVASGSFSRSAGCISYFLGETKEFLHELACAQKEPDMYRTCETWFTPRDFQRFGLTAAIAINEAILSHWCSQDVTPVSDSTIVDPMPTRKRKRVGRPQKYSLRSKKLCIRAWEKFRQNHPNRPTYEKCFKRHECELNMEMRVSLQTNGEVTTARDFRCCVKAARETRRLSQ
jgi:hypothetical protein